MPESSTTHVTNRSPLFAFYVLALAFAAVLVLARFVPTPWEAALSALMAVIAVLAIWALVRFLRIADERQRRTTFRSLRSAFVACLVVSLLGGFVQGFGALRVSWLGVLGLQLISWSLCLIFYSWRDQ